MIFAPGDALTEEVDDDLTGDAGDAGNGEGGHQPDDPKDDEHGDGETQSEEHEEVEEEIHHPPEAGNTTEYPGTEDSAMLGVELPCDEKDTPIQEISQRQISDESVVGAFQLSNDVGDHPACALDSSQEFAGQLTVQPPGQEIILSPSTDVEDSDVVVDRCTVLTVGSLPVL